MNRLILCTWVACLGVAAPMSGVEAQEADPDPRGDRQFKAGHDLFKRGEYLEASERYRLALLKDSRSAEKKVAFAQSLFAIGNFSYASYAIRRVVADMQAGGELKRTLAERFPSRAAFTAALKTLKRFVDHEPRDPTGLTVLSYVLYTMSGEEARARQMLEYLQRLDGRDKYATAMLARLTVLEKKNAERKSEETAPPPKAGLTTQKRAKSKALPGPIVMSVTAESITVDGMEVAEADLPRVLEAAIATRRDGVKVQLVGAPGADAVVVRVLTQLTRAGIERVQFSPGKGK